MVLGSAFGVMFATMTTLMVVSIRVQHRESLKIRTEVSAQIERAFDKLRVEFTEVLDSRFGVQDSLLDSRFGVQDSLLDSRFGVQDSLLGTRFSALESRILALESGYAELKRTVDDNHRTTQKRLDAITSSLVDARERLARIEGHLGIGPDQRPDEPHRGGSNAA
jgi:hypothetical protein